MCVMGAGSQPSSLKLNRSMKFKRLPLPDATGLQANRPHFRALSPNLPSVFKMFNKYDSPRSFDDACDCSLFSADDTTFFSHSFVRAKPKPQVLTKIGDESFFKLSKKVPPSFEPRIAAAPEFCDPLHKASLCFYVYLNESDGENGELLKIRPMKATYHLDNETISLFEPHSINSGHTQGRVFNRQKVPRYDRRIGEDYLSWKDFKIGKDLRMFGKNYRIVSCDDFTRIFLTDRGIPVPDEEKTPLDAWNVFKHFRPQQIYRETESPSRTFADKESDMQSWGFHPQMLFFRVAWLDSKNDFHGTRVKRVFKMAACPEDDTVALTELTPGFDNVLFLKASRLPYSTSDNKRRYYHVNKFHPGIWIDVFKRPMYIFDCDGAPTRAYIKQQFGEISYGECPWEILERGPPLEKLETLPTELILKAVNHEFPGTEFVIFYYVNAQCVDIFEESKLREWSKGRTFLLDINVSHLSIKDFQPGSKLKVFKWWFELTDPHPNTEIFFKSLEPQNEISHMQMYEEELNTL